MIKDLYTIIIAAVSENGVIGKDGEIPWHLPVDLKRFKKLTSGYPVIMGRKTYESLPKKFRPLPRRLNIVLSHQKGYLVEGAYVYNSLEQALEDLSEGQPKQDNIDYNFAFVIGGQKIYEAALPIVDFLELTYVKKEIQDGTAHFPPINFNDWVEEGRTDLERCSFVSYTKKID